MTTSEPSSISNGFTEDKNQKKGNLSKPAEAKDEEDLAPASLHSSKISQNTSADEVRAPGIFERVKEEVEAIAESIHEDHLNHKSSGNQGGCFSWFGFGGFHKQNQSQ